MKNLIKKISSGNIFIYPTDTIYGIGCDATNFKAVQKIKKIKKRDENKPLSIIAPSIKWIKKNCIVDVDLEKYFPGPYTLILKKKNKDFLSHISDTDSLGIRISDSEFTREVQKSQTPFVTTSVNLSSQPFATKIEEISTDILEKVDEIIDNGELNGKPSTLIINGKEVKR